MALGSSPQSSLASQDQPSRESEARILVLRDKGKEKRRRQFRGRSSHGCLVCRKRRVKCDQSRPACNNCVKGGRRCDIQGTWDTLQFATIPLPLEDPSSNPDGIFSVLTAQTLPNLDSLWYWIGVRTGDSNYQSGWLGGLREPFSEILQTREPAVLCITAFMVLKLQATLISADTARSAVIAKNQLTAELKNYKTVTGSLLVCIGLMALLAVREHDHETAEIHLKALRHLCKDRNVTISEWIYTYGTDWRINSGLMSRPIFPYYMHPDVIRTSYPAHEATADHRLAADNALQLLWLLEKDYLEVLHLLEGFHSVFKISPVGALPFDKIYDLRYRSLDLLGKCRVELLIDETSTIKRCRTILALVFALLSWRYALDYIPQEGLIQFNMLGYAKTIVGRNIQALLDMWPDDKSLYPLLWMISILCLESIDYRAEDQKFWTTMLQVTAEKCGTLTASSYREHIKQWPYPPSTIGSTAERFQILMSSAGKANVQRSCDASAASDTIQIPRSLTNSAIFL